MADNIGYTPGAGAVIAADEIAGVLHQRIKLGIGADGVAVDVSAANPMPITTSSPIAVTGPLTDAELRAVPVQVSDESADFLLNRILNLLNAPQGYDKSLQRYRQTATIESGTLTTVATVTTVTNIGNFGSVQAQILPNAANLAAWQACCRSRIT